MAAKLNFALNHMTAPRLDCRAFVDLAASLGCIGVELRNDLTDKKLTGAAFFDGEAPAAVGAYARSTGLRLLGLSEAYGFNAWSDAMSAKVQLLIDQAVEAGAESISLIPCQTACKTDPGSASNFDPLVVHDGERPIGWSWSGLRSPVGRVDLAPGL